MTRQDILEASAQIFSQKGFHGTSMQDIAEAVNLQKASLYYHVSSKQEILFELLNQALDLLIERISSVLDPSDSPDIRLRKAMSTYLKTLTEYQDLASVLLLEHRSLVPELSQHHIPRRDRFESLWRDLILEGQQAGVFSCSHPSLTARALLGVMNWTITWYREGGPLSAEEIAGQFTDLFLFGLIRRNGEIDGQFTSGTQV
jgi:AcrR family transcriptional regulator